MDKPEYGYTIHGKSVDESTAFKHWLKSESYDSARAATRSFIWDEAHLPDGGQYGARAWLAEAGIEVEFAE